LLTTDIELAAMATEAIIGLSNSPVMGYNTPAAIGMPKVLYINAKNRFCFMFLIVARDSSIAVTTPPSSPLIRVRNNTVQIYFPDPVGYAVQTSLIKPV